MHFGLALGLHVCSNTLVHLERFKNLERGVSLNSMATVVDLSKGNYLRIMLYSMPMYVL